MAARRRTVRRTIPRPRGLRDGPRGPLLGASLRLPRRAPVLGVERAQPRAVSRAAVRQRGTIGWAGALRAACPGRLRPASSAAIRKPSSRSARPRHAVTTSRRTAVVQDSHSPARFARLLSRGEARGPLRRLGAASVSTAAPARPGPARSLAPRRHRQPRTLRRRARRMVRTGRDADLDHGVRARDTPARAARDRPRFAGPLCRGCARARGRRIRVFRMFVWFVFRDRSDGLWQSGLLWEDSSPKPALERFAAAAQRLDARNPVLPESAEVARVPALELAYYVPAGTPVDVTIDGVTERRRPLERDGWLDVPLGTPRSDTLDLRVTDPHGHRSRERYGSVIPGDRARLSVTGSSRSAEQAPRTGTGVGASSASLASCIEVVVSPNTADLTKHERPGIRLAPDPRT